MIPPGGVATWVLEALGPSSPAVRSALTLDPTGVAGPGVYLTWASLWTAYLQTSGAVEINVLGQTTVPAGTYVFRNGTILRGVVTPSPYNLLLADGAVLQDLQHVISLPIRSVSNSTSITFSTPSPGILFESQSGLINAGTVPMIQWTTPNGGVPGGPSLFMVLDRGSQITNETAVVINAQGPGPSPAGDAYVGIIVGLNSTISGNALSSPAFGQFQTIVISPTATVDTNQPGYTTGTIPVASTNFTTRTTMQAQGTNNPQAADVTGEAVTTDNTPTSLIPPETLPNIGENLLVLVTAVRGSDGETATWFQQVRFKSVGGVVSGLATDVTPPNIDAGLLVGPVAFNVVFNVPAGQVDFQGTGQNPDSIRWTIRIIANLCQP